MDTQMTALKECMESMGLGCEASDEVLELAASIPTGEEKKIAAAAALLELCEP